MKGFFKCGECKGHFLINPYELMCPNIWCGGKLSYVRK